MDDDGLGLIPPLQGCLYCHAEGTTELFEPRKILGFGNDYPVLKCRRCESTALLDYTPTEPSSWRIRYKHVNTAPRYYYVALHLGKAGWLSAEDALEISTNGFVQRRRVQQAHAGDLSWLRPAPLHPPPPLMHPNEAVYLTLRGVTLQEAPPSGFWVRSEAGTVLDSGKFYVTGRRLHLLGQRRDWSHPLDAIAHIHYDAHGWTLAFRASDRLLQYRGMNIPEQFDAQLVAAIIETLWQNRLSAS